MEDLYNTDVVYMSMMDKVRANPKAMHFFAKQKKTYFYLPNGELEELYDDLEKLRTIFNEVYDSLNDYQKEWMIESSLINEVYSSLLIDNVIVERQEIFNCYHNSKMGGKQVATILQSYKDILNHDIEEIVDNSSIRRSYDNFTKGYLKKQSKLDGNYYRKDRLFVTNGVRIIHNGFYPEHNITSAMQEFFSVYNDIERPFSERYILSYFLLETIRPFYGENGSFARYILSKKYYEKTGSLIAFFFSNGIYREKEKCYHALNVARGSYSHFSLGKCMYEFGMTMKRQLQRMIDELNAVKGKINILNIEDTQLSKTEKKVYLLIIESSYFQEFGICNEDIIKILDISKRSVISSIQKLRELDYIDDYHLGKYIYHKTKK